MSDRTEVRIRLPLQMELVAAAAREADRARVLEATIAGELERAASELSALAGAHITAEALKRMVGALDCGHPKETTTRPGWTIHWAVCPRCITGGR